MPYRATGTSMHEPGAGVLEKKVEILPLLTGEEEKEPQ